MTQTHGIKDGKGYSLTYEEAVLAMAYHMDKFDMSIFQSSSVLALLYTRSKEETLDDLSSCRGQLGFN